MGMRSGIPSLRAKSATGLFLDAHPRVDLAIGGRLMLTRPWMARRPRRGIDKDGDGHGISGPGRRLLGDDRAQS